MKRVIEKFIVTGCNGYLGNEVCKTLYKMGENVLGVYRKGKDVSELEKMDIKCIMYDDLPLVLKSTDCFIHCAGKTGLNGHFEEFQKTNVDWTLYLFKMASFYKVSCFVYISSIAAVGYSNREKHNFINEDSKPILHQNEFYGRSKLEAEKSLQKEASKTDIRLIILRPGLIYGNKKLKINNSWLNRGIIVDPDSVIPFIHIDNLIDAIIKCIAKNHITGVYNVVDNEQLTQKDLAQLKKDIGILKHIPYIVGLNNYLILYKLKLFIRKLACKKKYKAQLIEPLKIFYSRKLHYDCTKIKTETGWEPAVSLKKGWQKIYEISFQKAFNKKNFKNNQK